MISTIALLMLELFL